MIAVDTNILVYSHRGESVWNNKACEILSDLVDSGRWWCIPAPCLHEFFATVTNHRIFRDTSTIEQALKQIEAWLTHADLISELPHTYWSLVKQMILKSKTVGPKVHDLRILAICEQNGVDELWSADRDYLSFNSRVTVRNPLVV